MEKKIRSQKALKNRRLLFVLPILVLPFISLLFWTFKGGKVKEGASENTIKKGLNFQLPDPQFKEGAVLDKMSYYDQATADSLTLLEQRKKDPNYNNVLKEENSDFEDNDFRPNAYSEKDKAFLRSLAIRDPAAEKIYQKLASLQKVIDEPVPLADKEQDMREFDYHNNVKAETHDIRKLEQMMSSMSAPQEADPELKQLGGMLENILDIQHPERVKDKLRQSAKNQKGKIHAVTKKSKDDNLSLLQSEDVTRAKSALNAFYSLDEMYNSAVVQNTIEAVIHETQTIVSGSVVKLRLINEVFINGATVPKNSFLFGTASLKGERLEIKINTIRCKNAILPVELAVYDMDGLAGIYIPGTLNRESAKASADRSIQSVGLAGMEDSWGAQAAGLGVEAAKSFLSKKVKLIKVVLKSGYQVLLYDEKQKNSN